MASPGCRRGQWGSRCSIHARRNLPDKAFGYLKRVRVTPGVNRPLARLNPSFRYRHRPGFSDYTNPFGLAVACVFIKQSKPPCHCNLGEHSTPLHPNVFISRRFTSNITQSFQTRERSLPHKPHWYPLCNTAHKYFVTLKQFTGSTLTKHS